MKLKPGDSIMVKKGVKEPDFEKFEFGGWQGRVTEIDSSSNPDHILVTIEWDFESYQLIDDYRVWFANR